MSDEFTSMSLNEIAAAIVAGFQPVGIATTVKGRKVARFVGEARDAVIAFNAARNEAARLLQLSFTPERGR
jgi:hypothetical protein